MPPSWWSTIQVDLDVEPRMLSRHDVAARALLDAKQKHIGGGTSRKRCKHLRTKGREQILSYKLIRPWCSFHGEFVLGHQIMIWYSILSELPINEPSPRFTGHLFYKALMFWHNA